MQWSFGNGDDMIKIKYGKPRKVPNKKTYKLSQKTVEIPAAYAQLVQQLLLEDMHGDADSGHESRRRQSYARQVLDSLGYELDVFGKPGVDWRSKVLNPIIQRQFNGVSDVYSPSIHAAISGYSIEDSEGDDTQVTISDATAFYLGSDPLDLSNVPTCRRNIVYIREMRWHLSILLGKFQIEDRTHYNATLSNQDYLTANLDVDDSSGEIPPFCLAEVLVIYFEHIEDFFKEELQQVVSITFITNPKDKSSSYSYSYRLDTWRLRWQHGPHQTALPLTPKACQLILSRLDPTTKRMRKKERKRMTMGWIKRAGGAKMN